jgi:hypothetical protein
LLETFNVSISHPVENKMLDFEEGIAENQKEYIQFGGFVERVKNIVKKKD